MTYVPIFCLAKNRSNSSHPPRHPTIETDSSIARCSVGMLKKTYVDRPTAHSLTEQGIVPSML